MEKLKIKEDIIPEKKLVVEPVDLTAPKKEDSAEKVEVDKIQLENILERIAELEGRKVQKRAQLKNKICRVRFIDDKIVTAYGKSWEKRLPDGGKVLVIEVITEDKKKHEVEFIDFNENGTQLEAEIIDSKKEEKEEKLGFVFAKKVDYDNYRTYETDKEVPLINKSVKFTYKLRLPDGKEIWLDEEAIN
uniref:Uncharacterized protein n=1 Tax=viral metagenome TaxID=1070528 RepID=A0A6H1ZW59_9ZZZZ